MLGLAEIGLVEVGLTEVGLAEVGLAEVGLPEVELFKELVLAVLEEVYLFKDLGLSGLEEVVGLAVVGLAEAALLYGSTGLPYLSFLTYSRLDVLSYLTSIISLLFSSVSSEFK